MLPAVIQCEEILQHTDTGVNYGIRQMSKDWDAFPLFAPPLRSITEQIESFVWTCVANARRCYHYTQHAQSQTLSS